MLPLDLVADPARDLRVDTGCDLHTHSHLTDGADSPEAMADAAVAAGLRTWGLSDHVRADSDWLDAYLPRVRAIRRPGLTVRCGVEAKILNTKGRLDLPAGAVGLDYVLVADHQFPSRTRPVPPRELAGWLASGRLTAAAAVDDLVTAMAAAVVRAPFPPVLVHPFSLLPKAGLDEELVGAEHLAALADACHRGGGAVEVNEKWQCPSRAVVTALARLGVPLVAGSDAHRCADVGAHSYLRHLAGAHAAALP